MRNKKVVYTCLTGSYEDLVQHSYTDSSYDYICFSNDLKKDKIGMWEIREIPYNSNDNQLMSRYPKLQPHKVLDQYEYSLYVDANVNIKTPFIFNKISEFINNKTLIAGVKHQSMNCLYEEGLKVLLHGKEKRWNIVKQQMKTYKSFGFPRNYGMYEANVIFREHNNLRVIQQSNDWWFYRLNYSKRDQLSFSFTLWKNKIPFTYLLPENQSTRNSEEVCCIPHPPEKNYLLRRLKNAYLKFVLPILHKAYFPFFFKNL